MQEGRVRDIPRAVAAISVAREAGRADAVLAWAEGLSLRFWVWVWVFLLLFAGFLGKERWERRLGERDRVL